MIQPSDVLLTQLFLPPVKTCRLLTGGRNSQLYLLQTEDDQFVLKIYPQLKKEVVNRFQVESQCFAFFAKHHVTCVPRLIQTIDSAETQAILISYIPGIKPEPTVAYLDAVFDFLAQLKQLSQFKEAHAFPLAASPYLCLSHLYDEILQRLNRFYPLFPDEPLLADFFDGHFSPCWEYLIHRIELLSPLEKNFFHLPLSENKRVLIPGDFGTHNTLFDPESNQFYFFDFEYFGWDDPIRLICDFLYHPAMNLSIEARKIVLERAKRCYGQEDPDFEQRLVFALPFFMIRWVLIILNEFLPERQKNRGGLTHCDDWESIKLAQLKKAETLLNLIHHVCW